MAPALRECRQAILIGDQTFGKGVGQDYIDVGVLGWIKSTLYRWYSPNGVSIHRVGIKPDFDIKDPAEQMKKAFSLFE